MAFKLAEAFVDVFARTTRLTQGFDLVRGQTNALAVGLNKMGSAATTAIGGYALVKFFDKVVTAAMESETSIAGVKAALRSTGQEVEVNTKKIDDMANALRDQSNFSDEAARAAATHAIKLGASADQAIEMTKAGAGLADLFGGNLLASTNAVSRAQQGNWMSLQRMIPALRHYHTVQEKMDFLVLKANQGLGEQSEKMETTAGKLQKLTLAWSELQEAIGDRFLPVIKTALDDLTTLIKKLTPGTVENNTLFTDIALQIYEAEKALNKFAQDYRGLTQLFLALNPAASLLVGPLPSQKELQKQYDEIIKNIDYVKDLEKKENGVASTANKNKVGQINAINAALGKQQRILSGMPAFWKKVQESLFDPDIAFGAGRGGGRGWAGGGRMPKARPSGVLPTRAGMPPAGVLPTQIGPMGMPQYGTPFHVQPGYMGSDGGGTGSAGGTGGEGSSGFDFDAGGTTPPAGNSPEAHRRWQERWNAHKGPRSRSGDPTQVGGVNVPRSVVRDREWHRQNVVRLRDRIAWREKELYYRNFQSGGSRQGAILERDKQDLQRSLDISVHGTKAEADRQRAEAQDLKATKGRIRRQREEIMAHGRPDSKTYALAGPIGRDLFGEQQKFNEEQAKRMAQAEMDAFEERSKKRKTAYQSRIDKENAKLGQSSDREAESVRKGLQQRYGVTGPTSGGPLKVFDVGTPTLVGAINKLSKSIDNMNTGTFGESEDE